MPGIGAIIRTIRKKVVGILQLLLLSFAVRWREWLEAIKVIRRYFPYRSFASSYLWLKWLYLFNDPYRISRNYCRQQGAEDLYVFGETPLTVLHEIMAQALPDFGREQHVFELGAGSGFTSLWLNTVLGCRVTAIEQIPLFCRKLDRVVHRLDLKGIEVLTGDYLETDLSAATLVYLYGSNLDDQTIRLLAARLADLREGARIVTVSYPLAPYAEKTERFELVRQFTVMFPWGEGDVFVQARTSGE